jgi:hypothetical protein
LSYFTKLPPSHYMLIKVFIKLSFRKTFPPNTIFDLCATFTNKICMKFRNVKIISK